MSSLPEVAPARPRLKPPSIRQASFDDYEQIAAVEASLGLTPRPREEWLHLWQDNPACEQIPDWPIGWVLENEDKQIVGSIGNIPLLYQLGGRTYVAATFRGWAVDQRYRAFSLMLITHKLQHPGVDLQMVTTAGPMPQAVFGKLGWVRVPVGQWDHAGFWVTNYAEAARLYLKTKATAWSGLADSVLRAPLLLTDRIRRHRLGFHGARQFEWSTGFDERFDRFWTELQESEPSRFLSSRTKDTLAWHFRGALKQKRVWILTACDGHRLVGYAILQRKDAQSMDLTRMMLVDLVELGGDPKLASVMIAFALDRCRQERIHVLENAGCWIETLQPAVKRPSHHRPLEAWCYLYKSTNRDLAAALGNASYWYPTQYDGDASL